MKNLVVVESPTKAKTLAKFLGKDYVVKASMGHIRDLPVSKIGIDIENNFKPEYVIPEKAEKNLAELLKYAKDAEIVYLATDPDREGEAIAWHLEHIINEKTKKSAKKVFKRAVFHEITKSAIEEAFAHSTELNKHLIDAQQGRRVLDRLVGYKLSPLLWKKVRYGLSAGRVQSVAVRLVVEREKERRAFIPDEYWTLDAKFSTSTDQQFKASLAQINGEKADIKTKQAADKIFQDLQKDTFKVGAVKIGERKRQPGAPFKTSTLQQAGSNIFGYQARQTMSSAQKLFEKGLITYHRTDSLNLSPEFLTSARAFIKKHMGASFLPDEAVVYKTKSKNAQEAHEAIRPTDLSITPKYAELNKLTDYERNVYTLIYIRSLECQMVPAVYETMSVDVISSSLYTFRAGGSKVKFAGFLDAGRLFGLSQEESEENESAFEADVKEGDKLGLVTLDPNQHFTQPPARFSDATLVKTLEELEIGRPSTYAPTISTIIGRGYVRKEGKYFVPEDVSFVVSDMLVEHFPSIVDYQFTASVEEDLDKVAEGTMLWQKVIKDFYFPFEKNLAEKELLLKKTDMTKLGESDEKCPECGKILFIKLGKYGKFLSCSGFPECKFAKPILDENEEHEDFGACDLCNDGKMIIRQGKFGKFLACSNYPKCKNAKPYLQKIGVSCPKCKEGDVVIKKAKRRNFYGCSRYPECDFASWKIPTADTVYEPGLKKVQPLVLQPPEEVKKKIAKPKKAVRKAKKIAKPTK